MNDLDSRGFPGIFDRRGGQPLPELEPAARVELGALPPFLAGIPDRYRAEPGRLPRPDGLAMTKPHLAAGKFTPRNDKSTLLLTESYESTAKVLALSDAFTYNCCFAFSGRKTG
jgi:hypothetical protein